jgi:hypothetical protein
MVAVARVRHNAAAAPGRLKHGGGGSNEARWRRLERGMARQRRLKRGVVAAARVMRGAAQWSTVVAAQAMHITVVRSALASCSYRWWRE